MNFDDRPNNVLSTEQELEVKLAEANEIITEFQKTKEQTFLYDTFDQYAEFADITRDHPYYVAFKLVWSMARTPDMFSSEEE
jgi:hypothetical protein